MNHYHRRDILKIGAAALVGSMLPFPVLAAISNSSNAPRTLAFFNTHTAESVEACYYKDGVYQPDAMARINYVMRDHRCDAVISMDLQLLDVLHAVKSRIGRDEPFHVISGYRTPKTNELLRRTSSGVVRTSLHMKGKAVDIRLPGYCTKQLRHVCIKMRSGGVGYYPKSDFVHVDTGNIRTW